MYIVRVYIHAQNSSYVDRYIYRCVRCTYTYTALKTNECASERTHDVAVSVLEMVTLRQSSDNTIYFRIAFKINLKYVFQI